MDYTLTRGLLVGVAIVALMAAGHLLVPALEHRRLLAGVRLESVAGGISVAFVFLHLLPDMSRGNERLGEVLGSGWELTPVTELGLFLLALGGFVGFYGLEHMAGSVGAHRQAHAYGVHLGVFAALNILAALTLPWQLDAQLAFGLLFGVAISGHLVLVDRILEHHWRRHHEQVGRHVLAASVATGWGLAWLAPRPPLLVLSLPWAFVGGAMLLDGLREELPPADRSSFPWFLVGVGSYGALMALAQTLA